MQLVKIFLLTVQLYHSFYTTKISHSQPAFFLKLIGYILLTIKFDTVSINLNLTSVELVFGFVKLDFSFIQLIFSFVRNAEYQRYQWHHAAPPVQPLAVINHPNQ